MLGCLEIMNWHILIQSSTFLHVPCSIPKTKLEERLQGWSNQEITLNLFQKYSLFQKYKDHVE